MNSVSIRLFNGKFNGGYLNDNLSRINELGKVVSI